MKSDYSIADGRGFFYHLLRKNNTRKQTTMDGPCGRKRKGTMQLAVDTLSNKANHSAVCFNISLLLILLLLSGLTEAGLVIVQHLLAQKGREGILSKMFA